MGDDYIAKAMNETKDVTAVHAVTSFLLLLGERRIGEGIAKYESWLWR